MGNASARPPASGQQQLYLADPSRYLKEDMSQMVVIRRIGNGRFMKSYLCKEDGVELVVKVYVKQEADEYLAGHREEVEAIARKLGYGTDRYPNVLPCTPRRSGLGRPRAARVLDRVVQV